MIRGALKCKPISEPSRQGGGGGGENEMHRKGEKRGRISKAIAAVQSTRPTGYMRRRSR